MRKLDYSPLIISLKTAIIATAITFVTGIISAYWVVKIKKFKGLIDGIFTLPLVLPPTVCGFFLLKIFGLNGFIGKLFYDIFNFKIVFSWEATIIASTVVSFPLMYRTARGAFEQLDKNLIYSAKTLGLSNTYIFVKIVIPNSISGIIAGSVLAFARALGEFGATIMLAGNIQGKTTTISTAVYSAMSAGNYNLAYKWVLINLLISFIAIGLLNFFTSKQTKSVKMR